MSASSMVRRIALIRVLCNVACALAACLALSGHAPLATPAMAAAVPVAADPADRQFEQPRVSGDRDDFGRALQAPVDGFLDAAGRIHARLLPWGLNLLVLLTGSTLVWLGVKTMLERGALGLLMTEFITLLLTAGILFSLLDNWVAVTAAIVNGTGDVARQVSGNVHDRADAINGVHRLLDAGFALWEYPVAGISALRDPVVAVATLLFKLLILGLLLLCGCIYLGMYLLSMALLAIAFALGPVFIPWLLVQPASFLFDGWLRFTLIAALYQIVGIVIVTLVSTMHDPTLASLGSAVGTGSTSFNFFYFSAAFLLSGVSALLMLQIPVIANGLVSGAVGVRFQPGRLLASRNNGGGGSRKGEGNRSSAVTHPARARTEATGTTSGQRETGSTKPAVGPSRPSSGP